jgi:hypothetical protein
VIHLSPRAIEVIKCQLVLRNRLAAWVRLERAHILGQRSTPAHVPSHLAMLRMGRRGRDVHEIIGQVARILGRPSRPICSAFSKRIGTERLDSR